MCNSENYYLKGQSTDLALHCWRVRGLTRDKKKEKRERKEKKEWSEPKQQGPLHPDF